MYYQWRLDDNEDGEKEDGASLLGGKEGKREDEPKGETEGAILGNDNDVEVGADVNAAVNADVDADVDAGAEAKKDEGEDVERDGRGYAGFHAGADDNTAEQRVVREAGILSRVIVPLLQSPASPRDPIDDGAHGGAHDGSHDSSEMLGVHAACAAAFAAASEQSARELLSLGAVDLLFATLCRLPVANNDNMERAPGAAVSTPVPVPLLAATLMALGCLAAQPSLASSMAASPHHMKTLLDLLPPPHAPCNGGGDGGLPPALNEALVGVLLSCLTADASPAVATVAIDESAVAALVGLADGTTRGGDGRAMVVTEATSDTARTILTHIARNS